MRAVCQRVTEARVRVAGSVVGEIESGLLVLLGIARSDTEADADRLAAKIAALRVFENEEGKFDRSLVDVGGDALVVSQFTLLADTAKGNRPSFTEAAPPAQAEPVYSHFCAVLAAAGVPVREGVFGARMSVELVNDGPVTVILG